MTVLFIIYIISLIICLLGYSGWLRLIGIVPLIGTIAAIVLFFGEGGGSSGGSCDFDFDCGGGDD